MFFVPSEVNFFSAVDQEFSHLGNRPLPKDLPLLGGDGNHHAPRGISDLMGEVITGHFSVNFFVSMHVPQGRFNHGKDVVGHQGDTESKQRRGRMS